MVSECRWAAIWVWIGLDLILRSPFTFCIILAKFSFGIFQFSFWHQAVHITHAPIKLEPACYRLKESINFRCVRCLVLSVCVKYILLIAIDIIILLEWLLLCFEHYYRYIEFTVVICHTGWLIDRLIWLPSILNEEKCQIFVWNLNLNVILLP